MGDWWFPQEYLCEFVATTDQVFANDHVMGRTLSRGIPANPAPPRRQERAYIRDRQHCYRIP